MKTGLVAFEVMFEIIKLWEVLGQRSNNDFGLLFSRIFIYSLRQNKLPIFRRKYSKLSMKSYKHVPIFDLAVK